MDINFVGLVILIMLSPIIAWLSIQRAVNNIRDFREQEKNDHEDTTNDN